MFVVLANIKQNSVNANYFRKNNENYTKICSMIKK